MVGGQPATDGRAVHPGMTFHPLVGDVSPGEWRGLREVVRLVDFSADPHHDVKGVGGLRRLGLA